MMEAGAPTEGSRRQNCGAGSCTRKPAPRQGGSDPSVARRRWRGLWLRVALPQEVNHSLRMLVPDAEKTEDAEGNPLCVLIFFRCTLCARRSAADGLLGLGAHGGQALRVLLVLGQVAGDLGRVGV